MYGSVGTDAAHSRLRVGPLLTRLTNLRWPRTTATASQAAGLILPAFRSRLQTSMKRQVGSPAGLVPVA